MGPFMNEPQSGMEAWRGLIGRVLMSGKEASPRNKLVKECYGLQAIIDMEHPIIACKPRKLGKRFMFAEPAWILSGSNRLEDIASYAPTLREFSDDGIFLNGAYGPPIVDQLPFIITSLSGDPDSRQAVISIWRPKPRASKDIPCTISLQFILRSRLHVIANMRSSDLWLGFPYDIFTFTCVGTAVALLLKQSTGANIGLGNLVMNLGNAHLYSEDIEPASGILSVHEKQEVWRPYHLSDMEELKTYLWSRANEGRKG